MCQSQGLCGLITGGTSQGTASVTKDIWEGCAKYGLNSPEEAYQSLHKQSIKGKGRAKHRSGSLPGRPPPIASLEISAGSL